MKIIIRHGIPMIATRVFNNGMNVDMKKKRIKPLNRKKRIHINQHVIRANKKNGEANPPITVKCGRENHYTYAAEIDGLSRIVYSPDKPLSCGAKVWIETEAPVWIHTGQTIN